MSFKKWAIMAAAYFTTAGIFIIAYGFYTGQLPIIATISLVLNMLFVGFISIYVFGALFLGQSDLKKRLTR